MSTTKRRQEEEDDLSTGAADGTGSSRMRKAPRTRGEINDQQVRDAEQRRDERAEARKGSIAANKRARGQDDSAAEEPLPASFATMPEGTPLEYFDEGRKRWYRCEAGSVEHNAQYASWKNSKRWKPRVHPERQDAIRLIQYDKNGHK